MIKQLQTLVSFLNPLRIDGQEFFQPLNGFSLDSRTITNGQAFVALQGVYHDGHDFINAAIKNGARLIITEKPVTRPVTVPVCIVSDSYQALAKIVRFVRNQKRCFVYAVTGSVGKTTTKELLSFLLTPYQKVHKNYATENNILGIAKTVFSLQDEQTLILELGTNMPGEIETLSRMVAPDAGVITFIKPVHLQGLGDMTGVFKEKTGLFAGNPAMKAVLNHDDRYLQAIDWIPDVYWYGSNSLDHVHGRVIACDWTSTTFLVQDKYEISWPTPFAGLLYNILAAVTAATITGVQLPDLIERLRRFNAFDPLRMNISQTEQFTIFNDCYNANPFSFEQALAAAQQYRGDKIAVIADMLELGQHSEYYHRKLAQYIKEVQFRWVLTFGNDVRYVTDELKRIGVAEVFHCATHQDIAETINRLYYANTPFTKKPLLFLKGSRSMKLEKVLPLLKHYNPQRNVGEGPDVSAGVNFKPAPTNT